MSIIKNKIQRWIDTYFPEFPKVFCSWEGKTAIMTLEIMPLPSRIEQFSAEDILIIWKQEVKRGVGIKRAKKLLKTAINSVGIKEGLEMAEYDMKLLIMEYKNIKQILDDIEKKLEAIIVEVPGASNILQIKGIGIKTVSGIFAEIGDIKRFTHSKQIIKLAGLNLIENSSGRHKGQTTISKRGRSRLRAILYKAIMPMVAKNKEFIALHKHNITRKENPLKKKQSLMALCGKLIRIIYALVTKDEMYDPQKMLSDIHRDSSIKAA